MTLRYILPMAIAASSISTAGDANVSISGGNSYSSSAGNAASESIPSQRDFSAIQFGNNSSHLVANDTSQDKSLRMTHRVGIQFAAGYADGTGNDNPSHLKQTWDAIAQESIFDTLKLSGNSTASGKATLHMKLQFNIKQASEATGDDITVKYPDYDYHISANNFASVTSDKAILTGQTQTDYAYGVDRGGFSSANNAGADAFNDQVEILDFSLLLDFNDPTAFSVTLSNEIFATMMENEVFDAGHNTWRSSVAFSDLSLKFLDGISVTGDSGEQLCGLTVNKVTGELWGQTAACSVGGGGGGAGDVPEPASWTLMLGGFGVVGGTMRVARRKAPALLQ